MTCYWEKFTFLYKSIVKWQKKKKKKKKKKEEEEEEEEEGGEEEGGGGGGEEEEEEEIKLKLLAIWTCVSNAESPTAKRYSERSKTAVS
jgi:hypothetical protein